MTKLNYLFSLLCMLAVSSFAFAQPANDSCADAVDLSASLGQGADIAVNAGTYDNTDATTVIGDPATGFDCFGEPDGSGTAPSLDNTVWFKITGDGNVYYIQATSTDCSVNAGIDENNTQMAIYTGVCGVLSSVSCNENFADAVAGDYPAALELATTVGEEYYILVDGFNFDGSIADGEFCMFFTQQDFVTCSDPNVSGGIVTSSATLVCEGESASLTVTGALAPNEGAVSGYAWLVSTTDLQGNPDFNTDPGFFASVPITPEVNSPFVVDLAANGLLTGAYYFTLAVFGNATWINPNETTLVSQATLDAACTTLSNSIQIDYYETEVCPETAVLDVDESVLNMTVFPNPAQDFINLNINAVEYTKATIMITNIAGQMVQQQIVNLTSGANLLSMDMNNAPAGVYMVSIETGSHQSVSRFLKQ